MSNMNEQELNAATREVLKRAVADKEFRALAARDGSAAIVKVTGKQLPSATKIQFVDNHGKATKLVVIPDPVTSGQLAEEELEQVSGGVLALSAAGASTCANDNEMN